MKILLINGNTNDSVTAKMARTAEGAASAGTTIVPVTAAFGARIISSRSENAIASHAVLDAAAKHHAGCDAVLIGVSMDTGLGALREILSIPVVGMTEAACLIACTTGSRFGVVTLGTRTIPMYQELITGYGLHPRLAGIEAVDVTPASYGDTARVTAGLIALMNRLVNERAAESIVLAGAWIAGQHHELQPHVPVPLLDGITCGVQLAEVLSRLGLRKAAAGSHAHPGAKEVVDVDPALAALYRDK